MQKSVTELKNVNLIKEKRNGTTAWFLLRHGGVRDQYFDYYVKHLIITKKYTLNTKRSYCYAIARFMDYLIETAGLVEEYFKSDKWLTGYLLRDIIEKYPEVLACETYTEDKFIKAICEKLKLSELKSNSQNNHITAINKYLSLSETFHMQMRELGVSEINGLPKISEYDLFPNINSRVKLTKNEGIKITQKSMLGGVIAGGAKLKNSVVLSPYHSQSSEVGPTATLIEDDAFPIEHAARLINQGFLSSRDKALFSLCMAIGCRIHEALSITLWDIDIERRRIYLIGAPRNRGVGFYNGYFSSEKLRELSWKGRSTIFTLMIEPFGASFWKYLKEYMAHEMIITNQHPFLWQINEGQRRGHPLILTHDRNIRRLMETACKRIDIKPRFPHSLRHMYGVYILNYIPIGLNKFGLPIEEVQKLMGHAKRESTERYAKHDIEKIEMANRIHNKILQGGEISNWKDLWINVYKKRIEELSSELLAA